MSTNALAGSKKPGGVFKAVLAATAVAWFVNSDEEEQKRPAMSPRDVSGPCWQPSSTDPNVSQANLLADDARHFLGRPLAFFTSDSSSSSFNAYYRFPKRCILPTIKNKLPIQVSGRLYTREFHELGKLGSGAFGSVFRSQNLLDGNTYAVKKIRLPLSITKRLRLDAPAKDSVEDPILLPEDFWTALREPQVMATVCKHRNMVNYHHSWLEIQPNWMNTVHTTDVTPLRQIPGSNVTTISHCMNGADRDSESGWTDGYGSDEEAESPVESSSASGSCPDDYSLVLYIQMELCTGASLYDWLRLPGRSIDASENMLLFKQLLRGLTHLHAKGYCHRDVKPANLLLVPNGGRNRLKMGDFGSCKRLNNDMGPTLDDFSSSSSEASTSSLSSISSDSNLNDSASRTRSMHTQHTSGCGTYFYMAPELHTQRYDTSVDIFAAGIVLFELFHTFATEMERFTTLTQLHERRLVPREFILSHPAEAKLVLRMTHSDPTQRPTAFDLLNDPRFGLCPIQDLDLITPSDG